jgi:peptide/nickel transport system permease protein
MTQTQEPVEALPPSLPPQLSPRQIARARRRQAAARAWREYRRSLEGMIGLGILIVFVAVAIFVPLFVPASELDVTKATGTPSRPPAPGSRSGPTRAAARCSP